jgi:pyruvate dehydrogenase E2 component (dihydrolipoamide acetyltransferase)
MATDVTMPQLSDTMDKGTILKWFKKEGDKIIRGDALAEVATDKADLEIESFHEGILLKINASEGESVKVGEIIAVIGAAGEAVGSQSSNVQKIVVPTVEVSAPEIKKELKNDYVGGPVTLSTIAPPDTTNERVKISPLAKNIAKNHGVDYSQVSGSGEGGRIVKKDVEQLISSSSTPTVSVSKSVDIQSQSATLTKPTTQTVQLLQREQIVSSGQYRIEPLSRMRETIANRMVESVNTAPHFYATTRAVVGNLMHVREVLKLEPQYEGITVTHMIIKACGNALRKFPRINSKFENGNILEPQDINIGIITALPDGLLIPVVKSVDMLQLSDIVQESRALVQRAKSGKPKGDDLSGGTFSISNIGRSEVEHFTAIINPGQGAILAVSSVQEEPIVQNSQIVVGQTLRLTLSVDHRIIDGVLAGEFLTYLKKLLEEPVLLLA